MGPKIIFDFKKLIDDCPEILGTLRTRLEELSKSQTFDTRLSALLLCLQECDKQFSSSTFNNPQVRDYIQRVWAECRRLAAIFTDNSDININQLEVFQKERQSSSTQITQSIVGKVKDSRIQNATLTTTIRKDGLLEPTRDYFTKEILPKIILRPRKENKSLPPKILSFFEAYQKEHPTLFDRNKNRQLDATYYDKNGRDPFRVYFRQGKLYTLKHRKKELIFELLDTSRFTSHEKTGWGMFVTDYKGDTYIASHGPQGSNIVLYHSSFLRGKPVRYAGEVRVVKGELKGVTNYSGHYMPSDKNQQGFLTYLLSKKVPLDKTIFHEVRKKLQEAKLTKEFKDILDKKRPTLEYSTPRRCNAKNELDTFFDWKKALRVSGWILFGLLSLAILTTIILVSHGAIIPFLGPLLLNTPILSVILGFSSILGMTLSIMQSVRPYFYDIQLKCLELLCRLFFSKELSAEKQTNTSVPPGVEGRAFVARPVAASIPPPTPQVTTVISPRDVKADPIEDSTSNPTVSAQ